MKRPMKKLADSTPIRHAILFEREDMQRVYYDELMRVRRERAERELSDAAKSVREDAARWRLHRRMGKTLATGGCL